MLLPKEVSSELGRIAGDLGPENRDWLRRAETKLVTIELEYDGVVTDSPLPQCQGLQAALQSVWVDVRRHLETQANGEPMNLHHSMWFGLGGIDTEVGWAVDGPIQVIATFALADPD